MTKVLKAVFGSAEKPLKIGDTELPCYVLEDGTRVIHQKGMQLGLGMSTSGGSKVEGTHRLGRFAFSNAIKPFMKEETLQRIENPIKFRVGNLVAHGYEATILTELCDAIVQAKENNKLLKQQNHIGTQALKLLRAFATVGIIALVDEATGYQEVRKRNELQQILEAYLKDEFAPWTKKFPDEYYKHLLRLRLGEYDPALLKRKPSFVGTMTNKLVYEKLPNGVLQELKKKTPKSEAGNTLVRYHQFLTEDIGEPHLQKQLIEVITLMKISKNKGDFLRFFAQAFPEPDRPIQESLGLLEEEKLPE